MPFYPLANRTIFSTRSTSPYRLKHASCPICRKTFVAGSNTNLNLNSTLETAIANTNAPPNAPTSGSTVVGDLRNTNRSAAPSTPVTNQNVTPNYDYTEDDCD